MSQDRHQRAMTIFGDALALAGEERQRYLEEVDSRLRSLAHIREGNGG